MTTSDAAPMKRTEAEADSFCLFVFCSAHPLTAVSLTVWGWQFTSVYLDAQAVWIWITFSSRIPLQEILVASCYGYSKSERHLVRQSWPVRPYFPPLTGAIPVTPLLGPLFSTTWKDIVWREYCEDSSPKLEMSQVFPFNLLFHISFIVPKSYIECFFDKSECAGTQYIYFFFKEHRPTALNLKLQSGDLCEIYLAHINQRMQEYGASTERS